MRIPTVALVLFFLTSPAVRGQEPQVLVAGLNAEHSLGPGESHAYTIALQDGAAVIGEADQHGIDLVIDVFGPNGKLIRTIDSPNGAEGPEPIDVTAIEAGTHKLVIRAAPDQPPKPGKYVLRVDRVLTVEANAQRMAEKNYPSALQGTWRAYISDPHAVETFVAGRKGKGPIVEDIPGNSKYAKVTYIYYGNDATEKVRASSGSHAGVGGILMQRFMQTPLFFASETVPRDAKFRYGFAAIETRFVGANRTVQLSNDVFVIDSLNPEVFDGLSVLTMPSAHPLRYTLKTDSVQPGKLTTASITSIAMREDRRLTVYTPPGYDAGKACDLVIVFDGRTYDGSAASDVPTPTILDNLIAAKKINPVVAVFVNNMGNRARDLTGYPPFAAFVANELVPWVRKNYRINSGPGHVVVAGSSFGGLASSYVAFMHSDIIGNVLSQSGSYWVTKDTVNTPPFPLTEDSGDIVADFRTSKRLPIKFYMEIGRFDAIGSMLGTNRELRDVLLLKGYQVDYHEFDSGHDYIWWRESLADGLISLLGRSDSIATNGAR
jgi:enterochelin esterase-like enzyme